MRVKALPAAALLALFAAASPGGGAIAAEPVVAGSPDDALTYADIAALADTSPLVVVATISDQAVVEAERAPGLAPGHARLYVEATTQALLTAKAPVGEALRYLVDVPLDAKGKPPKLKKKTVILFARAVQGRPGELQLVEPDSQFVHSAALEARIRTVLGEFAEAGAAPRITGIADVLAVNGTLVGESETQMFLDTASGEPASITVTRRPGQAPRWGVSWSEIVDQAAQAPTRDTLEWYRLACTLPARLPQQANLASDPRSRALAAQDYAYVREQLGPCRTTRD